MRRIFTIAIACWLSNGAFAQSPGGDPADASYPGQANVVWRGYTVAAPSVIPGNLVISTEIARSFDAGAHFQDQLQLNTSHDVPAVNVTEVFEAPTLLNDPADPNGLNRWKMIVDHHFNSPGQQPVPQWSWLGFHNAVDPTSGVWGPETKLLATTSYDPNNGFSPGAPLFYSPPGDLDCTEFHEPSAIPTSTGYYISLDCIAPSGRRTELLQVTYGTSAPSIVRIGTLLTEQDAANFAQVYGAYGPYWGQTVAFTGGQLLQTGTAYYLITTPVVLLSDGSLHNVGCVVVPFWDVTKAELTFYGASPWANQLLPAGLETGACTYATHDTGSGIIMEMISSGFPILVNTGVEVR